MYILDYREGVQRSGDIGAIKEAFLNSLSFPFGDGGDSGGGMKGPLSAIDPKGCLKSQARSLRLL
jgi:hypothetical protein